MDRIRTRFLVVCAVVALAGVCASASGVASGPGGEAVPPLLPSATYSVHHALTVKDVPAGARRVRVWCWLPDDDDCQKVLDISVTSQAAAWRITRDAEYGHRYLYAEFNNPASDRIAIASDFIVRRSAVSVPLDPEKAGSITPSERAFWAEHLRRDCPNMEVTQQVQRIANEICGTETNAVRQAKLLFDWVVDHTNHYSRPGAPKSSGKGSVEYCLANHGGACTDQHALFIALARARGIPARLQFGTLLKPANEGKDIDPGYRCWVQYFVPHYGWVPMDISAANTNPDKRQFYFCGLDERRVRFAEGRDLELTPRQDGPRLNLLIAAYVEVDGKPHPHFDRVFRFNEIR